VGSSQDRFLVENLLMYLSMSLHSKWANIKRKKAVLDSKRADNWNKLIRLLVVSAKKGGGDLNSNPNLRLNVERAKEARMPKENIEKAIKRGTGELEGIHYEEAVYEGYGPDGGAFLIECLTDNKNRTVAELRTTLSKNGGSLGSVGSTAYIFSTDFKNPIFKVKLTTKENEELVEKILEALNENEDVQEVYTNYEKEL
jgi:YebC/PmpR family DNA-binding regulatory protein